MSMPDRSRVIRLTEAQARIPGPAGEGGVMVLRRGPLDDSPFPPAPEPTDAARTDEIYFIIRGRGVLIHDSKRDPFESGDILFVAAGTEHQFEDTTDDLALWRVFTAPIAGDVPI